MKIFTSKRMLAVFCALLAGAAILQSCGGETSALSNQEIAELQSQLDSTMQLYQQAKLQNADFDKQMASRDSAINAQAAEIQSLINQLNGKKPAVKSTPADLERQQKVIREKENTIKQLQKQLDQQSQQLKALKSGDATSKDKSAEYKNQIAQLQKQIAQQEKQINNLKKEVKNQKPGTANCDQVKNDYEGQVKDLNNEIKTYKMQIADLNKQIKSLKSDVNKMKTAVGESDQTVSNELTAAREELRQMTIQLIDCRKLNTQYQNDVKAAKDNLAQCQNELASSQSQLKSLQTAQNNGSKSEDALRSQLADLTKKEAECRSHNEELTKIQKSLVQECENDKQALQATISDLQQQVISMQTRVDQLTSDNASLAQTLVGNNNSKSDETSAAESAKTIANLTAQVESQRAQIAQLQEELQQKNNQLAETSSKPSKGTVNQKLAELQALCDSYVAEIERLRAENEQLKTENAELKDKVSSSAGLIAENERLQQKVKMASVLVTSDLKVTPGKSVKVGNVVKPTTKASQTQCIRLDCKILDNNVVDPGSVTIYARISDASDRAIYNGNAANFSFDLNGVTMQYTTKQDIEFTGSGRNLTMLWRKGENVQLASGLYWIKLYANGYEIGKASFKLD